MNLIPYYERITTHCIFIVSDQYIYKICTETTYINNFKMSNNMAELKHVE